MVTANIVCHGVLPVMVNGRQVWEIIPAGLGWAPACAGVTVWGFLDAIKA